jgi:hypothetical protein
VEVDPLRGESGNHGNPGVTGDTERTAPCNCLSTPRPGSVSVTQFSPPRLGARGSRGASAAVSARPVRGCAAAHRAEEPGLQPRA